MNITFVIGAEGSFKEKAFVGVIHAITVEKPEETVFYNNKVNLDNIEWYGTKPVWAQMERIDKAVQNSMSMKNDNFVYTGWHLPELLDELIVAYPDANYVLVRPLNNVVDTETLDTVSADVGKEKLDEIISNQKDAIDKFLGEHPMLLIWDLYEGYETAQFTTQDF